MSASEFHIILQIKTPDGFEPFGKFVLGTDQQFADNIFRQLKGEAECDYNDLLQIDLAEVGEGLPRQLKMISCCLEDIAENCRIITREVFKYRSLEP